ncbi:microviridin/marinostatin family tricyclic proteinase inhibitor [Flavobacterium sp. '19STA2R22 D10 B1']|uniref:microviridin/marinostatin family tricyclic proteinase inhibitor n=1 Tax=Flavobacterium aerium TaxID=3037261 RepID=UPI00278C6CDB|nr:microviridin/marinostatin family tricyclic proteinase inhibitor [Flavobacterium sp. '19STA2R22 D10 B1']
MKSNKDLKKPFFANFLENQLESSDKKEVQGGVITQKYPSDSDESGTLTRPEFDEAHTMKYPSDSDESGPFQPNLT